MEIDGTLTNNMASTKYVNDSEPDRVTQGANTVVPEDDEKTDTAGTAPILRDSPSQSTKVGPDGQMIMMENNPTDEGSQILLGDNQTLSKQRGKENPSTL